MEVCWVNFIIFGKESITLKVFREPSRPTSGHRLRTAATNTAATTWHSIDKSILSFYRKSPMHNYTQDEVPVNHLFQQYVMLKNAIRKMGGYEADELVD